MTNNQSVAISHSSFFSPGSFIPSSHGLDLVIPNFWGCRGKKRFTLVIPQSPWKWKSLSHVQLFATPMDYRLPGSSVQGILQARILEFASPWDLPKPGIFPTQGSNPGLPHCRWILYHLSHQGSPVHRPYPSCIQNESESHSVVSDSLWTPRSIQSMEFSRPEYWSGQPFPSPGDLPNSGIKLRSPTLQADSLPAEPQGSPNKPKYVVSPYHR